MAIKKHKVNCIVGLEEKLSWFAKRGVYRYLPLTEKEKLNLFKDAIYSSPSFEKQLANEHYYHMMYNFIMTATFGSNGKPGYDWLVERSNKFLEEHKAGVYGNGCPRGELWFMESYWRSRGMDRVVTPLHDVVDFLKKHSDYVKLKNSHKWELFDDELALTVLDFANNLKQTCLIDKQTGHVESPALVYCFEKYGGKFDARRFFRDSTSLSLESFVKSFDKKKMEFGEFKVPASNLVPLQRKVFSENLSNDNQETTTDAKLLRRKLKSTVRI